MNILTRFPWKYKYILTRFPWYLHQVIHTHSDEPIKSLLRTVKSKILHLTCFNIITYVSLFVTKFVFYNQAKSK